MFQKLKHGLASLLAASLLAISALAPVGLLSVAALAPQPAQAQALSDYVENNATDFIFRAQTWTLGASFQIGLSTSACSDSSVGTEVTGGSYARVSYTRSMANWAGTQAAASTTASTGTGGQTSNNAVVSFAVPTAGWGLASHFFVIDASNLILCQALTVAKTINTGDTVSFPIGSITVTLQ